MPVTVILTARRTSVSSTNVRAWSEFSRVHLGVQFFYPVPSFPSQQLEVTRILHDIAECVLASGYLGCLPELRSPMPGSRN